MPPESYREPPSTDPWVGLIRYYGALVVRPGWQHLRPMFELVKQISTSRMAAIFPPSLVGDTLFIAARPIETNPAPIARVSVEYTDHRTFLIKQFDPGATEYRDLECTHEQVFNLLMQVVKSL